MTGQGAVFNALLAVVTWAWLTERITLKDNCIIMGLYFAGQVFDIVYAYWRGTP